MRWWTKWEGGERERRRKIKCEFAKVKKWKKRGKKTEWGGEERFRRGKGGEEKFREVGELSGEGNFSLRWWTRWEERGERERRRKLEKCEWKKRREKTEQGGRKQIEEGGDQRNSGGGGS